MFFISSSLKLTEITDKIDLPVHSSPVQFNRLNRAEALFSVVHSVKVFFNKLKMAKVIEQDQQSYKSRLFHFKGMFENTGRHTKSLSIDSVSNLECPREDLEKHQIANGVTRYDTAQTAKEEFAALKEAKDKMVAGKSINFFYPIVYGFLIFHL